MVRTLQGLGYRNLILKSRAELDLRDMQAVHEFFSAERPQYVFMAAAKVGGILANETHPAQFLHENLAISLNVIHESWKHGVERLLYFGSSCIYPRDCQQPISEESLLTGPLERTNRAYAIAKICGIELCAAYNKEYGTRFIGVMPTNLYGPGDNYDLKTSHVLPALIHKAHLAKESNAGEMIVWGSGSPRREFMYSEDLADACVLLMNLQYESIQAHTPSTSNPAIFNIGYGSDQTIRELAEVVNDVVGFRGVIRYDSNMPDGTPKKLLDSSAIRSLGWMPKVTLREGIERAYRDFKERLSSAGVVWQARY
jgi:GDP-L-fucose synthase